MTSAALAALLWGVALFRLTRTLARPHAGALRALTIALFAIAVGATVNVPAVAAAVDSAAHWPNVTAAIQNATIVVTAAGNQVMLLHLDRGAQLRPAAVSLRWCAAAATCVAVVVLFIVAGRGPVVFGQAFGTGVGATGWLAVARVVAYLYSFPVLVEVAWLCRRQSTRTSLGAGVALLGVGAAAVSVALMLRLVYLGGRALDTWAPLVVYSAGSIALDLGGLLIAVSVVLTPVSGWVRGTVSLRTLASLWSAVVAAQPRVLSRSPDVGGAAEAAEHRVVQIQDGLYMMALTRGSTVTSSTPLKIGPRRAAARIAAWVADPQDQGVRLDMFAAPEGMPDAEWVRLIADAYRRNEPTAAKETTR